MCSRLPIEIVDLLEERSDPDFDYVAELRALEQLYREEFRQQPGAPSLRGPADVVKA
jgi:hypothetical protein